MCTPEVSVYYDGVKQDYVELLCNRDEIVKMKLIYHKQIGSEHVLTVNVKTNKKVLATFKFGQKTFSVVSDNLTFDGFYDTLVNKTKQFKLGDYSNIKHLIEDNEEQMERLINQDPVLKIEIKEWIEEKPIWQLVADGCRRISNKITTDGAGGRVCRDGEVLYETYTDSMLDNDVSTKPIGYETNVLNKNSYVNAKGTEGRLLSKIKITFVSKQFINIV